MMTLEQIAARLGTEHLPEVQAATGLSYNTLKKIRDGKGALYFTVVKLSNHFADVDAKMAEAEALLAARKKV